MDTFSGFNSRIDSRNEIPNIKEQNIDPKGNKVIIDGEHLKEQ